MNTNMLRAAVASYLRYKRQCVLIAYERGTGYGSGEGKPDVLGVTEGRKLIEVELKTSFADFRNDGKKWKWKFGQREDRQFYYAIPYDLIEKIEPEIENGIGLMATTGTWIYGMPEIMVVKKAKSYNHRLSLKEIVKMAKNQSATLCSLSRDIENFEACLKNKTPQTKQGGGE